MRGKERRWKLVALLAVGVAIGVLMGATPAVGHVAGWVHNWNKHIKPRTDARYYKKGQAEARYVNVGETAANAHRLDGFDANELVRAISGTATVNTGVNTSATANVLTATAPRAGGLLVNLSFTCASFTGTADTRWDVSARVDGVNRALAMVLWFRGDEGDLGDSASTTVFVPVAAGDHTVGYQASRSFGDNTLDCNIAASSLFVPFNNAGNTPARAAVSAPRGLGNGG
jgi:hypothetical protein